EHPGVAAIVRAIEAGFFCLGSFRLDQRVHALAVGRDLDANPSPIALGKPVYLKMRPGFARILRTVKAAPGSIERTVRAPRRTMRIPCAGKQELRRGRTHCQI